MHLRLRLGVLKSTWRLFVQDWNHRLDCGDVDAVLASNECDHVLEGEARVGGQEHFYLEPNAAIVIPKEMDEIESFSSTQARCQNKTCRSRSCCQD
jgi:xanthine dehydrogenase/oxidase